jgi:multidrug efflux pump subunit AcrB
MRRALVVLGLIACGKPAPQVAPVDHDRLAITVSASLPGASATEMATSVAIPLELQVGQIRSLAGVHSRSTAGATTVVVEFVKATDPFAATTEVQHAITAVANQLPATMPAPPTVARVARTGAVMRLTLASETLAATAVAHVAQDLASKLEQIAGVGRVERCGAFDTAQLVKIDAHKLEARGKTVIDVVSEVRSAGSADDLVLTRDVATIEEDGEEPACIAIADGKRVVAVVVMPQPGSDPLEVRGRLEAAVPALIAAAPRSVQIDPWPRKRPDALELRFPAGETRDAQVAKLRAALASLPAKGHVLVELGLTASRVADPTAADLRVVDGDVAAIRARLAEDFIVLDPSDHVVGFAGGDPDALRTYAIAVRDALAHVTGLRVVDQLGVASEDEVGFAIDRDAAARVGVSAADIATTIGTLVHGGTTAWVMRMPVTIVVGGLLTDNLSAIHVRTQSAQLVPLAMLAKVTRTSEPPVVLREGMTSWVGLRVSGPLDALTAALAKLPIPAGIQREVREPD